MVKQVINTGTIANDGTGDTLRIAGRKINENFSELYTIVGGDSAAINNRITRLTDSGLDLVGAQYKTKIGFTEGLSNLNIDFPDSAGTVIVSTATQTMTNKTLSSANLDDPIISDMRILDVDSSHSYRFVAGSLSANHNINIPSLTDSDTLTLNNASQTLTNKSLSAPVITNAGIRGHFRDSNGADLLHFLSSASAVNHMDIQNAATGQAPKLSVEGDDTNINFEIFAAGTGAVEIRKIAYGTTTIAATGTVAGNYSYVRFTGSTTATLTIPNGTKGGEMKVITHDGGAVVATVAFASAANFAQGTSIALDANDTVSLIWNNVNSEWNIIGGYGYTVS